MQTLVQKYLDKHKDGVRPKGRPPKPVPDKEVIENMLMDGPVTAIAEEFCVGKGTVYRWISIHALWHLCMSEKPTKGFWAHGRIPSKEVLNKLAESLSMGEIADEFKVGIRTVYQWFEKRNLKTPTERKSRPA